MDEEIIIGLCAALVVLVSIGFAFWRGYLGDPFLCRPSAVRGEAVVKVVLVGKVSQVELTKAVVREAKAGNMIVGVPLWMLSTELLSEQLLEEMADHRRKAIAFADEVVVVTGLHELDDVGMAELDHARALGKAVRWHGVEDAEPRVPREVVSEQ